MTTDLITLAEGAVLSQFLGPFGKAFGEAALKRAQQLGEQAVNHLKNVGRAPQPVEPKVLLPLVQGAVLETDEGLAAKWAALLANAADPAQQVQVQPAFVEILRQLMPADTLVLNRLYFPPGPAGRGISAVDGVSDSEIYTAMGYYDGRLSFDNLIRLRLCSDGGRTPNSDKTIMWSTELGFRFMKAVTPPTPEG